MPLVQVHVDYFRPLKFNETIEITARLHWCQAMRLNHTYEVRDAQGNIAATGYTVQLFQTPEGEVALMRPPWLEAFWTQWQAGELP